MSSKCIKRYDGDHRLRTLTCREHFYVMCFAQLNNRESLHDIESCLAALSGKLYHSGIKRPMSRSTLADANENRNWRIYADFAQVLIERARELYLGDNEFLKELDRTAYALDSTTIDLCLNLFPWATFRRNKGAVKRHTLLDLQGSIPVFIDITDGLSHDVNILDRITIEPGAFYVRDMAYTDFGRLYRMHLEKGSFLIRAKSNMMISIYDTVKERFIYCSDALDKNLGYGCEALCSGGWNYWFKKINPSDVSHIKKSITYYLNNSYLFRKRKPIHPSYRIKGCGGWFRLNHEIRPTVI